MKKVLLGLVIAAISVLFFMQIKNNNSTSLETRTICIENRLNILTKEMDLHLQLVGQNVTNIDNSKCSKIALVLLDKNKKAYDFSSDLKSAIEYYSEKIDTTEYLAGTKLLLLCNNESSQILKTIEDNIRSKITVNEVPPNYFAEKFSLPQKGIVVLLLNNDNVCLYAYYLEQNNARKFLENSPVIFTLIKNLK